MVVNRAKRAGLGKVLAKAKTRAKINYAKNHPDSDRHTTTDAKDTQDWARLDLRSVTAQSTLDDFLETAELAGTQFVAEKQDVNLTKHGVTILETIGISKQDLNKNESDCSELLEKALCIPRRPKWDSSTTPEQLDEMEKSSFLEWRRNLASLQEFGNILITPFEKNLELWRQLWRVVERSDIVVQILDSRNPLLYWCEDLVKYVDQEFDGAKQNAVLLNKADFLTEEQRRLWAEYFKKRNIRAIFFSALQEAKANEKSNKNSLFDENSGPYSKTNGHVGSEEDENSDDSESKDSDAEDVSNDLKSKLNIAVTKEEDTSTKVFNKFELLDLWKKIGEELISSRNESVCENDLTSAQSYSGSVNGSSINLTVGLVGYPNVGKSSTINALLSAKRVAVSATPGKTKHFQTFIIDQDMMLCDCPGLVFPNVVGSKADMVINGVLPIDQMKDYMSPVHAVTEKIPGRVFENLYGLAFNHYAGDDIYIDADDLLNAYGFMRGYMTQRGLPDVSRASRKVLKDYINGKLLYCHAPPGTEQQTYHTFPCDPYENEVNDANVPENISALRITERQRKLMSQASGKSVTSRDFDAAYIRSLHPGVHIKGLPGIGNMTMPLGTLAEIKKEKREKKHKKKEKLRRVYGHLDE